MSPKQKFADLRQKLERWKCHNEVHAKPADNVLYEFLSEFLKLADYDDSGSPEEVAPIVPEIPPTPPEVPHMVNTDGNASGETDPETIE